MLFLTISRICQLFSGKEKKDHIIYQISEHDIMDHKGFFIYIKSQEILKFIKKTVKLKDYLLIVIVAIFESAWKTKSTRKMNLQKLSA